MPKYTHPDWRPPSVKGKLLKSFLKVLGVSLLLVFLLWLAGDWRSAKQLVDAEAHWRQTTKTFPESEQVNLSDQLLEPLWKQLRTMGLYDPKDITAARSNNILRTQEIRRHLEQSHAKPLPMDPGTTGLLARHDLALKNITEIVDHPAWQAGPPEKLSDLQVSALVGAHQLLTLKALALLDQQMEQKAEQVLETAWLIHRLLNNPRDKQTLRLSLATATYHAGVLRRFQNAPGGWHERLDPEPYHRQFLQAFKQANDALLVDPDQNTAMGGIAQPVTSWGFYKTRHPLLTRPWRQRDEVLFLEVVSKLAESYQLNPTCGRDFDQALKPIQLFSPAFGENQRQVQFPDNVFFYAGFLADNEWFSVGRLALDFELTKMVLDAQDKTVEEIRIGQGCEPHSWQVIQDQAGHLRITLDGPLPWPSSGSTTLPLEHQSFWQKKSDENPE